jgi:hypothetical protein
MREEGAIMPEEEAAGRLKGAPFRDKNEGATLVAVEARARLVVVAAPL